MKDVNGVKFEVGDVFVNKLGKYREVIKVFEQDIVAMSGRSSIEKARAQKILGCKWDRQEIIVAEFKIVQRKPLGLDSVGNEVFKYDEVISYGTKEVVLGRINGFYGNTKDYFILKASLCNGGWAAQEVSECTKVTEPEIKISITKNGEPINEPLSVETARRWGIVK